ncbi:hypothetical protein NL676_039359 [Syzygium grande]|nr:hypothetical protein NL676_039359 [Syzygium grande]
MTGPGGTVVQGSGRTNGGNKGGGYGGRGRGRRYGGRSSSSSRSKKPTYEHTQTHGASSSIVALRCRRCFRLSKLRSRASYRLWREKTSAATRKKTYSKRSTSVSRRTSLARFPGEPPGASARLRARAFGGIGEGEPRPRKKEKK